MLMHYRFGFALTTALGNKTRYLNLRKYADRDSEVQCVWAPITHYLEPDPYSRFPGPVRSQLILNREAAAIVNNLSSMDSVIIHAFQLFSYVSLVKMLKHRPLLVWYQDYAPFRDVKMLVNYGHMVKESWRRKLRYLLEVWFTRKADLYFPWSDWARDILINDCRVPGNKIHVVNVGVDLELWPYKPKPIEVNALPRILFVGGDFKRKGGDLLLEIFSRHFSHLAHLDLVTKQAPEELPANVRVHTDLGPNDPRLRQLYNQCDVFVLPTRADMSSIASIEAMATGRPVISTPVGGITSLIRDGENGFLVQPGDGPMLRERLRLLLGDAALRRRMGERGRQLVERDLNAEVGASRMLSILKEAVDRRRSCSLDVQV
jgi:glycosyltransferase involved in cell wall biosynthesis